MLHQIPLRQLLQVLVGVNVASAVGVAHQQQLETLRQVIHAQLVVLVPVVYSEQVLELVFETGANVEHAQYLGEHLEIEAPDVRFQQLLLRELADTGVYGQYAQPSHLVEFFGFDRGVILVLKLAEEFSNGRQLVVGKGRHFGRAFLGDFRQSLGVVADAAP